MVPLTGGVQFNRKVQYYCVRRHSLATPLADNCIWRQVRGSDAEVSSSDGPETSTEKVKQTFFSLHRSRKFNSLLTKSKPTWEVSHQFGDSCGIRLV
jgi:hypothetical protein